MKWIEFQKGKQLYSFNYFRKISVVHHYSKRREKFKEDPKEKKYNVSFFVDKKRYISIPEELVTEEEALNLLEEIKDFLKSDKQIYVVKKKRRKTK